VSLGLGHSIFRSPELASTFLAMQAPARDRFGRPQRRSDDQPEEAVKAGRSQRMDLATSVATESSESDVSILCRSLLPCSQLSRLMDIWSVGMCAMEAGGRKFAEMLP